MLHKFFESFFIIKFLKLKNNVHFVHVNNVFFLFPISPSNLWIKFNILMILSILLENVSWKITVYSISNNLITSEISLITSCFNFMKEAAETHVWQLKQDIVITQVIKLLYIVFTVQGSGDSDKYLFPINSFSRKTQEGSIHFVWIYR